MIRPSLPIGPTARQYLLAIPGAVLLGNLAFSSPVPLVLLLGGGLLVGVACRFPETILGLYFLVAILPEILAAAFDNTTAWRIILPGINGQDLILGAMAAAVVINRLSRLVNPQGPPSTPTIWIPALMILFGAWCSWQIFRNLNIYGLSAAGEFKSHYLTLTLPLYLALFLDTAQRRRRMLQFLLFSSLVAPMICLLPIGFLKGWGVGHQSRFFVATTSMGLVLGILTAILADRYRLLRLPALPILTLCLTALVTIILDSHRSVWFPGLIMTGISIRLTDPAPRPTPPKALTHGAIFLVALGLTWFLLAGGLGKSLPQFISQRAQEAVQVGNEHRTTWTWRIDKWKNQLERSADTPLTGIGFGGYWGLTEQPGDVGISPHNLYVQLWVKLGALGLICYLLINGLILTAMARAYLRLKTAADAQALYPALGIMALVGSHIYYFAYGLEDNGLMVLGLALAGTRYGLSAPREAPCPA